MYDVSASKHWAKGWGVPSLPAKPGYTNHQMPSAAAEGKLKQFHEGNLTRKSAGLNSLMPETFVEVSPALAAARGMVDGRMVNDVLGSSPELLKILMGGIDNRSGVGAIQNIAAIVELIGHLPPEPFRRFCTGIEHAMTAAAEKAQAGDANAPGVTGVFGLLRDEELWRALLPLVPAADAFARALTEETNRAPHPLRFQPEWR